MGLMTTCKPCKGSGWGKDKLNFTFTGKCEKCDGRGWIDESQEELDDLYELIEPDQVPTHSLRFM